jgi:hypothetical protein
MQIRVYRVYILFLLMQISGSTGEALSDILLENSAGLDEIVACKRPTYKAYI